MWARDLNELPPGEYNIIIEVVNPKLVRMKKFYFSMETRLAEHLGMSKIELHEAIRNATTLGRKPGTGNTTEYESISEVTEEQTMLARIYEFQAWAAKEFEYKFESYKTEQDE